MSVLFNKDSQIRYFKQCLKQLSHHYVPLDVNRLTLIYFCLSALDILVSYLYLLYSRCDLTSLIFNFLLTCNFFFETSVLIFIGRT